MIESKALRTPRADHPHIVLELRHVLLGCGFLGEGPRQHELSLVEAGPILCHAVKRGAHPPDHRVAHEMLHLREAMPRFLFKPASVEIFRGTPELDEEASGKVLRRSLLSLLAPKTKQSRFIRAHDDTSI